MSPYRESKRYGRNTENTCSLFPTPVHFLPGADLSHNFQKNHPHPFCFLTPYNCSDLIIDPLSLISLDGVLQTKETKVAHKYQKEDVSSLGIMIYTLLSTKPSENHKCQKFDDGMMMSA